MTDKPHSVINNKKNLVVRANRDMYSFISHKYYVTDNHPEGTFSYVWKILFKRKILFSIKLPSGLTFSIFLFKLCQSFN